VAYFDQNNRIKFLQEILQNKIWFRLNSTVKRYGKRFTNTCLFFLHYYSVCHFFEKMQSTKPKQSYPVKVDENILIPTLGGLRLACKLWQVADGRKLDEHEVKLICYPGWLDNSGSWDRAAEILCKEYGFAILAVDPPGCGFSDHRPSSCLYNDYEEGPLIADVADAIGWQTFGLLGHSRGGKYL
jgi:hypothetical protein